MGMRLPFTQEGRNCPAYMYCNWATPDSLPSASSLLLVLHQPVLQHSVLFGAGGMVHRQIHYLGEEVYSAYAHVVTLNTQKMVATIN